MGTGSHNVGTKYFKERLANNILDGIPKYFRERLYHLDNFLIYIGTGKFVLLTLLWFLIQFISYFLGFPKKIYPSSGT